MSNASPTPEFLAEDSSSKLIVTSVVFIVLLFIFAALRLSSQRAKGRPFALDDLFSYIGLVFILGECIIGIIQPPVAGVGRHVAYLEIADPKKINREYKIMFPIELLYISAFTFPKLALLMMYLKIFNTKTPRNITLILAAVITATWIAETLSAIFQCWPVAYIWDKSLQGHCVNRNAMFQFWSVPNIVTDTIMLVLPMPTVWTLQMSLVQKIGLTCTLLLGSIGLIASVVRFSIFTETAALNDATWASVPLQIWTIVEPSMYFFAGILPTLRPALSPILSFVKDKTGLTKQYISSSGSSKSRSYGRKSRTGHLSGTNSAWTQLPLESSQPGDEVALVEYSQTIEGGKGKAPRMIEGQRNNGITRVQEVIVTRNPV